MRPAPTFIDNLRAQSMAFSEAKQAHKNCGRFSTLLTSNAIPVWWKSCVKGFSQKCSTTPGSRHSGENWQCTICKAKQVNQHEAPPSGNISLSFPTTTISSSPGTIDNSLVHQCHHNQDLGALIYADKVISINICFAQESNLLKKWQNSFDRKFYYH